jgi:hypothetical protein
MKLDVTSLRAPSRAIPPRRPPVPQQLKDVAAAHRAKFPDDPNDKGWTGVLYLEKGSLGSVKKYAADLKDAGNALPVAQNASLYIVGFSYHAARAREAWVQNPPKDGKLALQVVLTPSWHVSDVPEPKTPKDDAPQAEWDAYDAAWDKYEKSCENYATKFALTNRYNVEVRYADGTVDRQSFAVKGEKPEFASASPVVNVDLARKGPIEVRGWADGSAGADGYRSARVTVIHNP